MNPITEHQIQMGNGCPEQQQSAVSKTQDVYAAVRFKLEPIALFPYTKEENTYLYALENLKPALQVLEEKQDVALFYLFLASLLEFLKRMQFYHLPLQSISWNMQNIYFDDVSHSLHVLYQPEFSEAIISEQDIFNPWIDFYLQHFSSQASTPFYSKIQNLQKETAAKNWMEILETALVIDAPSTYISIQRFCAPSDPEPFPFQMILLRSATREKKLLDVPELKIGSSIKYADYVVTQNPAVSRLHATIFLENNKAYLMDQNSTNGTYINGTKIPSKAKIALFPGDVLVLANEYYTFLYEKL